MFESEKAAVEFNKQVRLFYSFCEEPNTSLDFPDFKKIYGKLIFCYIFSYKH